MDQKGGYLSLDLDGSTGKGVLAPKQYLMLLERAAVHLSLQKVFHTANFDATLHTTATSNGEGIGIYDGSVGSQEIVCALRQLHDQEMLRTTPVFFTCLGNDTVKLSQAPPIENQKRNFLNDFTPILPRDRGQYVAGLGVNDR